MATIAVVGSVNMDLVVQTPRLPAPGETVLGGAFDTFPGGKGANQAVAAARQGAQVIFIGCVGQEAGSAAFGARLAAGLQVEGVDTRFLYRQEQAASGVALITVDAAGQNTIVVAPGANFMLTPALVQSAWEHIPPPQVLLLQLEIPLETVLAAARLARRAGTQVVLNPAPAQPLPAELLALVDVLIPNEHEAALLAQMPVETLEQAENAARKLLAQGAGCVVITLGARGALLVSAPGPVVHVPAYRVQVVDTTAAGDAFAGALAVALAEGLPLRSAVQRGCAAGALSATQPGAQPSLPTREAVERRMAQQD